MLHVYITRPIPDNGIAMLKSAGYRISLQKERRDLSTKELITTLATKKPDALLSFLTNRIDSRVLSAAPSLKIISNFAVGYDNIDVATAHEKGIVISNTPCIEVVNSVAEHTFALMLALSRRIVEADTFTRSKKYKGWDPDLLVGHDVYGKTLGIVGLGAIGRGVAQRANKGFGMKILYTDMKRDEGFEKEYGATFMPLEKLLAEADIISLHVPLLPSTHHLITGKTLKLMKKTALLVNTARGPVVDEKAILKALYAKKIGGFALDVFECEPHIDCVPADRYELAKLSAVIMTPHIASATHGAREGMAREAAQNIIDFFGGKQPKNLIK